jgi:hypothetical protein
MGSTKGSILFVASDLFQGDGVAVWLNRMGADLERRAAARCDELASL